MIRKQLDSNKDNLDLLLLYYYSFSIVWSVFFKLNHLDVVVFRHNGSSSGSGWVHLRILFYTFYTICRNEREFFIFCRVRPYALSIRIDNVSILHSMTNIWPFPITDDELASKNVHNFLRYLQFHFKI